MILLPLVLIAIVFILFSSPARQELPDDNYSAFAGLELDTSSENRNHVEDNIHHANGRDNNPANNIPLTRVYVRDLTDTGYLSLVNRQHGIQNKPYGGLITGVWPTVAVSRIDDMYLHVSALRAVSEMFYSARQDDIAAFFVSSGFRSYDAQALLYGDGSNSAFVQPPGHSEHHTGLAADILAPGVGMMEMAYTPEGEWLAANSYRYGLILRYPQGATAITGIEFEPWHFRYVGRVHAYFMKHNNLVLEEYIAYIHNYGQISFEKDGQTYYIMHKIPQDGMIYVPHEREFLVSADNKGGFILVAW